MIDDACMGVECPTKNQCLRYTHGGTKRTIRKCTNGKKFLQDKSRINKDSMRK